MSRMAKKAKVRTPIQKRYCVIGYPIKHSLSPKLHNAAFRKLKIPARYEAVEVKPRDLAKFMHRYRERYAGGNVTIPHKQAVMGYLDHVSPEAKKIGAVNAIVNRRGKLIGYNTDVYGAMEALKKCKRPVPGLRGAGTSKSKIPPSLRQTKAKNATHPRVKFLKGQKVIVLGAGGAARAVIYGLKKAGARVTIVNRTLAHAKKLAKDFGCECGRLKDFKKIAACGLDILINTTSVGMWPQSETPLLNFEKLLVANHKPYRRFGWDSDFRSGQTPLVMDIIYRPRMTQLLRDAKRAGCKIITGDYMFFAQAAKSFELWTGMRPKFSKL